MKFAWEILHVHTGQKVLVLSAPLVMQLYSARDLLTQVFDALVFLSFKMFGVSFVQEANLRVHSSLQTALTDRHQLGTCHLLNFLDAILPPWQLTLTVFMQEIQTLIVLQLVHATNKLHVYSGSVQLVIFLSLC